MIEQTFSARRCRDTRKPLADQCPDVTFYRCPECGALFPVTGGWAAGRKAEGESSVPEGTAPDNAVPKESGPSGCEIVCCGKKAGRLSPVSSEAVETQVKLTYQITGGYNDNAVRVSWRAAKKEYNPEWIYLKTFTGGYLKYVTDTKRSPMVFALADTDAFAYCDEDPCLECVFRCKRGFVIYVYSRMVGLVEIPLDKMNAHWQSGAKEK